MGTTSGYDLTAVLIADGLGVVLAIVLIAANSWRFKSSSIENNLISYMILATMLSCGFDAMAFAFDGISGLAFRVIIWICNTYLYAMTMVTAFLWVKFLSLFMKESLSALQERIILAFIGVGMLILVVNAFVPVVFSIDECNRYARQLLFWYFTAVDAGLFIFSLMVYVRARRRSGALRSFPVGLYLAPVALGMAIQSLACGISLSWACMMIAMAGICTSLQNEIIFRDKLTDLYNRFYLDNLKDEMATGGSMKIAAMMLDLNGFKAINDNFGHSVGDEALKDAARILSRIVGARGTVVRYAGDEFVVLLNTEEEAQMAACLDEIRACFDDFNKTSGKPYKLTISAGCGVFDLSTQGMDSLMNDIDKLMYEDKRAFYASNAQRDRRAR